jgi:hypothetical protein
MKVTKKRVKKNLPMDRIERWFRRGMPTGMIAKNLNIDYMSVYNAIIRIKKNDNKAYKEAENVTVTDIVVDDIVDIPVKVNFSMKIYGISIKVTRVPSEIIFDEDYIEIN